MNFSITMVNGAALKKNRKNYRTELGRARTLRDAAFAAIGFARDRRGQDVWFNVTLRASKRERCAEIATLWMDKVIGVDDVGFVDRCEAGYKRHVEAQAKNKRMNDFLRRYSEGLNPKWDKDASGKYSSEEHEAFMAIVKVWHDDAELAAAIQREDYVAAARRAAALGFQTVAERQQTAAIAERSAA